MTWEQRTKYPFFGQKIKGRCMPWVKGPDVLMGTQALHPQKMGLLNHKKHIVEEGEFRSQGVDLSMTWTEEGMRRREKVRLIWEQHSIIVLISLH